jgi:hypothetical protein
MPQLTKGGKWVYGWCFVGPKNEVQIPPEACIEYSFQPGDTVSITFGSRRSGGFGIAKPEKLANSHIKTRLMGQAKISPGYRVMLPSETGIQPDMRLLVVRGSWLALGFAQRGPIIDEAQIHPEIQVFLPKNKVNDTSNFS